MAHGDVGPNDTLSLTLFQKTGVDACNPESARLVQRGSGSNGMLIIVSVVERLSLTLFRMSEHIGEVRSGQHA